MQENKQGKVFSIVSMATGIGSLVCCCVPFFGLICGIVALVFANLFTKKTGETNTFAKVGKICGIIGIVIGAIYALVYVLGYGAILSSSLYY